jgi:alpha-D-xyloside xylohydrolase
MTPEDCANAKGSSVSLARRDFLELTGLAAGGAAALASPLHAAAQAPPAIKARVAGGALSITPLLDNAVRVRLTPGGAPPPPSQFLVATDRSPRFRVRRSRGNTTLSLAGMTCRVDQESGAVVFLNSRGREVLRAPAGRAVPSLIRGETTLSVEQEFAGPAEERLFGGGQFQDGFLDIKGLSRRLTQVNTQVSLPFFLSSAGYGLLWHNYGLTELNPLPHVAELVKTSGGGTDTVVTVTTTEGSRDEIRHGTTFEGEFEAGHSGRHALLLDIGSRMASRHFVEIDGKALVDFANLWLPPTASFFAELAPGRHKVRVIAGDKDAPRLFFGPAVDSTVLRSPVAEALDYVVVTGNDGAEIVSTYRKLTGAAPMPPKWALGYIHCRERFKTQDELLANAREFRARRLPVDVIVQDWQYWGKHGWNAMEFDGDFYPDPAAMSRQLHEMDMRLMLSVWAKVDRATELGKRVTAHKYYIPGTDWIDFFNPEAAAFYWANERDRLLKLGVDCFWQDATEPENDDLQERVTAAGIGEKVRNIYPLQINRAVYEGQRRDAPRKRVFTLTRSAAPGQQRYGTAIWSGDVGNDWDTLKRQITAGLNFVAAGLPYWTVDAGGFFRPGEGQYSDPVYHERLIRWFQYATFLPLQRVHGYQTDTEFWRYGPVVERLARAMLELRYRLLPYIYSEAALVTHSGSSLMRPLVMDFPHDSKALDQRYSYMFGRALHVAPVFAPGATRWAVYLPETPGGWHDFWTGERRAGGRGHDVAAPIERIPLHVRAGSIVPLGPIVQSTAGSNNGEIELRVYPGADGRFSLYEDDGTSYDYERGDFAWIDVAWNDARRTLTLSARRGRYAGGRKAKRLRLVLPGGSRDRSHHIDYDGRPVTVRL